MIKKSYTTEIIVLLALVTIFMAIVSGLVITA
jgi:hypothetical protein